MHLHMLTLVLVIGKGMGQSCGNISPVGTAAASIEFCSDMDMRAADHKDFMSSCVDNTTAGFFWIDADRVESTREYTFASNSKIILNYKGKPLLGGPSDCPVFVPGQEGYTVKQCSIRNGGAALCTDREMTISCPATHPYSFSDGTACCDDWMRNNSCTVITMDQCGDDSKTILKKSDQLSCCAGTSIPCGGEFGQLCRSRCDGSFQNSEFGAKYSLNFSESYPPLVDEDPTTTFELTFAFFDVEYDSKCDFDYLMVTEQDGSQTKFCNSNTTSGDTYTTGPGSLVQLFFSSDHLVQHQGFNVTWTKMNQECLGLP